MPRTDATNLIGTYDQNPFPAADLERVRQFSLKLPLGVLPANSKLHLRAHCSEKMAIEDKSYCLRVPKVFVPQYLAPASNLPPLQDQKEPDSDSPQSVLEKLNQGSLPEKLEASGKWDL